MTKRYENNSVCELSIIVPIYNGEDYIERKIESLQGIKNLSYEVVISLNKSDDKTEEIIDTMVGDDLNFKIIKQSNFLPGLENYKRGFDQSKGTFIMASAVDDICDKNFYREAIAMLNEERCVIAVSPQTLFSDNSHGNQPIDFEVRGSTEKRLTTLFENIRVSHGIFYSLMRRETACELNLNYVSDYSFIGGDWLFDTRLALKGEIRRINHSKCVFGVKGISKSKNYFYGPSMNLAQQIFPYRTLAKELIKMARKLEYKSRLTLYLFAYGLLKGNIHRFVTQRVFKKK